MLQLAKDNLAYYDHVLDISRTRFQAGDIAQIDLDRLELQRVQYESDLQSAEVNLRTAKITLLTLLNERTPVEQYDVSGRFDFNAQLMALDEFRKIALATRPDLKAAVEAVDKAESNHKLAVAMARPIRRSVHGIHTIRLLIIRMLTRRWAPVLAFLSAYSIATRVRNCARSLTSPAMRDCVRRRKHWYSAT